MTDFVKIGNKRFETLLALTSAEQEKGLMNKSWPPPVMSFVYASPRVNKFWMKSTPTPLDIVFCKNNKIISIWAGEANSTRIIGGEEPSDLVVEFPRGTCEENSITVDDPISLECSKESLMKVLMIKSGFYI